MKILFIQLPDGKIIYSASRWSIHFCKYIFEKLALKTGFVVKGIGQYCIASVTVINAVNYHCITHMYYLEKTWKHINHIVFTFHQFMLVIQLSYSDSRMPFKCYYYFSSVLYFLRESVLWLREWMKHTAWVCSVLRDVHIVLDMNKMYPKRRDYLFYFNLNLDFLTLALEILYIHTLDLEKVQGKSLGCIKSRDDTSPAYRTTTLQGATAEGWKRHLRDTRRSVLKRQSRAAGCRPLVYTLFVITRGFVS